MLTQAIYHGLKILFMFLGVIYLYFLFTGDLEMFAHIAGIAGLLFLVSNLKWYMSGGK